MTTESRYSSVLTGAAFMLYEFKQLVALKVKHYSDKEIKEKVIKENIFQYEKISSLKRGIPYLLVRVNALDEALKEMVIEGSLEVIKIINLYSIMKTDRLFFEFMDEVIKEKIQSNNLVLEKKDLNAYFAEKAEQDEGIANWSESTIQKLKQVYKKILLETGMLKNKHTGEISRLIIDESFMHHLIEIGDARYLRAMGE
jgi:hypothetical protein